MPAAPRTLRRCLGLLVVALIAGGAGCRRSHHQVDPTCEDGKRDGQETAIDCGGPTCDPCEEGAACVAARDCQTRVCAADGYCGAAVCGDGVVSPGEACDDGNTTSGDGCSAACAVEEGWTCSGEPSACLAICGDGMIVGAEGCDDGNATGGDGCSAACQLEPGYVCPLLGEPCLTVCGDGVVAGLEQCDDGNTADGDGCSATCRWESGMACTGVAPSYSCHRTVCGDGIKEGDEGCDDGNLIPGDGCSATCQLEPTCSVGASCVALCGDGVVEDGEECDDGNTRGGDGCSATCKVEAGYTCGAPTTCETRNGSCVRRLPMVVRDFIDSANGGHPDFQVGCGTLQTGIVKSTLNAMHLPDLLSSSNACIQGAASFAQWYDFSHTGAWGGGAKASELVLWDNGAGGYVNRYGSDGSRWGAGAVTSYTNTRWCSNSSNDCAACGTLAAGETCLGTCTPWGSTNTCATTITTTYHPGLDGNPLFFPVDCAVLGACGDVTPLSQYAQAAIPDEIDGGGWQLESSGARHNFAFTTQVRFWFKYDAAATYSISFTGDDDVWVFVNGQLAIDLGGLHVPTNGSLTLGPSSTRADALGLTDGGVYEVNIFQAERKQSGSSYMLTLSGFPIEGSACTAICGDGVVAPGEQCDSGTAENTGGYGKCNADCTLGPRCGDGVVNGAEQCDNGVNADGPKDTGAGKCMPGCRLPPG